VFDVLLEGLLRRDEKRLFAYRNSDHVRVTGSRRVTSTRTSGSVAASPAASRDPPWK